jgi:hypothetical protein
MLAPVLACAETTPTPSKDKDSTSVHAASSTPFEATTGAAIGRFQLIAVPGHPGSPFLLDTVTGCLWPQVQQPETKRTIFIEIDVENLHWSWGRGSLQLLASRIDAAMGVNDQQKRALKESLQKTACGSTNVVLTPGAAPAQPTPSQPVQ